MGKPTINATLSGKAISAIAGRSILAVGTVADTSSVVGNIVENVQTLTETQLDTYLGARSILRKEVKKILDINRYVRTDVQAIAQGYGAVGATGKVTISGTATADGSLEVYVVDKDYKASVTVTSADTAAEVATAIVAALLVSVYPTIPVSAEVDGNDAKFTALDEGIIGNDFSIKVVGAVAGLTLGITAFSGGTGTATYAVADLPERRYTGYAFPKHLYASADNIESAIDARFNSTNATKDGVAFMGYDESYSNIVSDFTDLNSKALVFAGNKLAPTTFPTANVLQEGSAIMTPADWRVAEFVAIRALRLTANAPISDYVFATNLDQVGGMKSASLPYFNTPLTESALTQANILFTETEKTGLQTIGFTVIDVNDAESGMIMGALVTPYKTDAKGSTDVTFKYLNYIDTGSVCREYIFNSLKNDLAQSRLTNGNLIPDVNIQNQASLEGLFMEYYAYLGKQALVSTGEDTQKVADSLVTVIDTANRQFTMTASIVLVTQIGTITMPITQVFSL